MKSTPVIVPLSSTFLLRSHVPPPWCAHSGAVTRVASASGRARFIAEEYSSAARRMVVDPGAWTLSVRRGGQGRDGCSAQLGMNGACCLQRIVAASGRAVSRCRRTEPARLFHERLGTPHLHGATDRAEIGRLIREQAVEVDEDDVARAMIERVPIRGSPVSQ